MIQRLLAAADPTIFGTVKAPDGVSKFDAQAGAVGATNSIGLIVFISNMVRIATVGAGLFVFFNILSAGLMFISAQGDKSAPDKAKDRILYSVVGLAIIVFSYVIIALISFILFQDPLYILNPKLVGPAGP